MTAYGMNNWVRFQTGGFFYVRFQVLTAACMKMTVFWDITSCSFEVTDILKVLTVLIVVM
jgi:hypothetical protein